MRDLHIIVFSSSILKYGIMTALELKNLLFIGSNIIISANDYTVMNLKDFAFIAKQKGGNVIIRNAKRLTALECKSIAFINPGKITFDFTE